MNPLKAIGHFFKHLFTSKAVRDFEHAALQILKEKLGALALEAVKTAEAHFGADGDGAQKRDFAFSKLEADAKVAGISAGKSILNLLIELAVSQLRGSLAV